MKGWKTILFNALSAGVLAILQYAADVDWTQYVSPTNAVIIITFINGVLRTRTTTPIFKKETK